MGQLEQRLADDLDGTFPQMVRAHQDLLFSAALAMTRHRQDAEDVTQEVLVRAHRALQGYDRQRIADLRLRPWLAAIALNVVRNRARAASRRPVLVAAAAGGEPATDQPGPEQVALAGAEQDLWRERLGALPPLQRRAVVLRHVGGLSAREVAEAMDVPEGTARSHVSRGLAALRAQQEAG